MDYQSKARPARVWQPSVQFRWPHPRVDATRIRRMKNLPYILLAIGVIIALILLAAGGISYGVAILGFILVVVLAYYTWRLLD
jgi:Flp pilus assembly protein TadB